LFIAEGYVGTALRPDPPTIEALRQLMVAAGVSTEGARPTRIIDPYARPEPPPPPQPAK
jgi:hypothetical protein